VFDRRQLSYDALVSRYNSDLANGLRKSSSRTLTMIDRSFGGEIPENQRERVLVMNPGSADLPRRYGTRITRYTTGSVFLWHSKGFGSWVAWIDKYLTVEKPGTLPSSRRIVSSCKGALHGGGRTANRYGAPHPVLPAID